MEKKSFQTSYFVQSIILGSYSVKVSWSRKFCKNKIDRSSLKKMLETKTLQAKTSPAPPSGSANFSIYGYSVAVSEFIVAGASFNDLHGTGSDSRSAYV